MVLNHPYYCDATTEEKHTRKNQSKIRFGCDSVADGELRIRVIHWPLWHHGLLFWCILSLCIYYLKVPTSLEMISSLSRIVPGGVWRVLIIVGGNSGPELHPELPVKTNHLVDGFMPKASCSCWLSERYPGHKVGCGTLLFSSCQLCQCNFHI